MGRQSRLKRERRRARERRHEPITILRGIHQTIQDHCHEHPRRCWEYLLEMLAHQSGWQTDTMEAQHLWDKMPHESGWGEFFEAWNEEVEEAKRNRTPFSEPLGQLLEEIQGTSEHHGQYFTPMPVVRMLNELTMDGAPPPGPDGMPTTRGLDPCCGTGRFMIDALVHNDGIFMHAVDIDLWLVRTAMLNVRLLARYTSLHAHEREECLKPFNDKSMKELASSGIQAKDSKVGGSMILIGGRAIFMHADAQVVDLGYAPNWLCAGWAWLPRPWEQNLKIDDRFGFWGTWEQYQNSRGQKSIGQTPPAEKVRFDYSMREPPESNT